MVRFRTNTMIIGRWINHMSILEIVLYSAIAIIVVAYITTGIVKIYKRKKREENGTNKNEDQDEED